VIETLISCRNEKDAEVLLYPLSLSVSARTIGSAVFFLMHGKI